MEMDGGPHLRSGLKRATAAVHARLDRRVGSMPLGGPREYAAFLSAQYAARTIIEPEISGHDVYGLPDMPSQLPVLTADLAALGCAPPEPHATIRFETPAEALGAAWVVAGSSMGNRVMLAQRRKAGCSGPDSFLSDTSMPGYFRQLLELLESRADEIALTQTVCGARKAFALFEESFAHHTLEIAA